MPLIFYIGETVAILPLPVNQSCSHFLTSNIEFGEQREMYNSEEKEEERNEPINLANLSLLIYYVINVYFSSGK